MEAQKLARDQGSPRGSPSLLTVACVLKSGGAYDATWVERLQAGVARHLSAPYRFICLSDVEVACERIPLRHDWPGWWSKLEMFRLEGPVLYLDLDTAVVGDLCDIAEQATRPEFTALRGFYSEAWVGSGLMAWNIGLRHLYEKFAAGADGYIAKYRTRGDQAFIMDHEPNIVRWQDRLPGQIVSYKAHVRARQNARESGDGAIPSNARVVCLHGVPKFYDMPQTDPVRQAWEAA